MLQVLLNKFCKTETDFCIHYWFEMTLNCQTASTIIKTDGEGRVLYNDL